MAMKQINVAEATCPALDWAVATCEGYTEYDPETDKLLPPRKEYGWVSLFDLNYSTDWAQGGPIIEREGIDLDYWPDGGYWQATSDTYDSFGPTPLIAAMRCFVASKLGETAEVPEELL